MAIQGSRGNNYYGGTYITASARRKTIAYPRNKNAVCPIIDANIHALLIAEACFKTFTPKPLCDAKKSSEVLIALSCDSRTHVDTLAFEDLDGHICEMVCMDMMAAPNT